MAASRIAPVNNPTLWAEYVPRRTTDSHKYSNGPVLVVSGPELRTGASRLAAMAALHAGSGAVTLCGDPDALRIHAAHVTAIMLRETRSAADLRTLLSSGRYHAVVLGPAAGLGEATALRIKAILAAGVPTVLDADALTVLARESARLNLAEAGDNLVLTPHQGEFRRLFPDLAKRDPIFASLTAADRDSKLEQARAAARITRCTIVFKGPGTVIANPDGRAVVNTNGGPELATAGSGDVLAGLIAAHLAQGMPPFEAAASAVWLHAEAGAQFGIGLTAEHLANMLRPLAAWIDSNLMD
ncbi:MAG: NAD(P)H-hydrate dehydratase [Rhizobiales bacterium]|nr:NAD(P)H-hydrate dehydratase [Hyphomicrobiales bacterium]